VRVLIVLNLAKGSSIVTPRGDRSSVDRRVQSLSKNRSYHVVTCRCSSRDFFYSLNV